LRVKVSRTSVEGEVFAPPSKSYTHRAITIGSLSEKCVVRRPLISEDTKATIRACKMLGAQINEEKGDLFIEGVKGKPHIPEDVIDVGNSGTTLRFMTAEKSGHMDLIVPDFEIIENHTWHFIDFSINVWNPCYRSCPAGGITVFEFIDYIGDLVHSLIPVA